MSILRRLVNLFKSPLRYMGRDLEGNKFYEYPSTSDDPRRTKRMVQYKRSEDVWRYIGGGKRLPVQWSMWLTHTRQNPPTLLELQADMERQRRVLANVAMIEAREREEEARLRIERGAQDDVRLLNEGAPPHQVQVQPSPLLSEGQLQDQVQQSPKDRMPAEPQNTSHVQWPQKPTVQKEAGHEDAPVDAPQKRSPFASTRSSGTDEPEPWTPRTLRRGS